MKFNTILLYEDESVENLYPFSIMHPAWEVRCGAARLFEKFNFYFPDAKIFFSGRNNHLKSFLARFDIKNQDITRENMLIINSKVMPSKGLFASMEFESKKQNTESDKSVIFTNNQVPFALYLPSTEQINPNNFDLNFLPAMLSSLHSLFPKIEIPNISIINYLWDAIELNGKAISDDFYFFPNRTDLDKFSHYGVWLLEKDKISIGNNCKIAPFVVLDAEKGEIIIEDNVEIMANSVITGHCHIGKNSLIKAGAKIYENTSIGEWCKVGGEIENSIIQSYSNKQHEGFLGHSYLGEWINIGADTNTSDLKNTYGDITVRLGNKEINTRRMFLGLLCGDHTKSCINCMFTTGTVAGISGILVKEWFLPNYIPSFSWGGKRESPIFKVSKAIEIARIVMSRRNKNLLPEEEVLFKEEYEKVSHKF